MRVGRGGWSPGLFFARFEILSGSIYAAGQVANPATLPPMIAQMIVIAIVVVIEQLVNLRKAQKAAKKD